MQAVEEMASLCRRFKDELGWAGGNLNQAMKRANELSIAGLLGETYYKEVLIPSIDGLKKTMDKIISGTLRCRNQDNARCTEGTG